MELDIHLYAGPSLFRCSSTEDDLAAMRTEGPESMALLCPAKPPSGRPSEANRAVEAIACRFGWPFALRVDPWRGEEALAELERAGEPAAALFLHPAEEQFRPTTSDLDPILDAAEDLGLPVLLAAGYLPYSHSSGVRPLVERRPGLTFVLTHGAQINICGMHMDEAFEIFRDFPNTFFETSGIYRQDYIERAIRELGPERVVFGSGAPVFERSYERARIEALDVSDEIRARVLGGNARRILALA